MAPNEICELHRRAETAEGAVERIIGLLGLCIGLSMTTGSAKQLTEVLDYDPVMSSAFALLFCMIGTTAFWLSFFEARYLRKSIMFVSFLSWLFVAAAYFTEYRTPPISFAAVVMAYFCCERIWRLR